MQSRRIVDENWFKFSFVAALNAKCGYLQQGGVLLLGGRNNGASSLQNGGQGSRFVEAYPPISLHLLFWPRPTASSCPCLRSCYRSPRAAQIYMRVASQLALAKLQLPSTSEGFQPVFLYILGLAQRRFIQGSCVAIYQTPTVGPRCVRPILSNHALKLIGASPQSPV